MTPIQKSMYGEISYRQGANLPHWRLDDSTYAVTFRLADSIPVSVLKALKEERDKSIRECQDLARPLTQIELRRINYLFSERVETWLDRGCGACILRNMDYARIVRDSLLFRDGEKYRLHAWCVMPNHVHVVAHVFKGEDLSTIVKGWKGFTSYKINSLRGIRGLSVWQTEPYDHLVRDQEDLLHQIEYVLRNPSAAKLENWPWIGGSAYKGS
jgi:REP element-mobilizing transposase RayT